MIYCLGAAAVLAAVYFILVRQADEFIFHPVRGFLAGRLPGETFFLPSGNGKIQALYIPAREGKETLLFFHGNGGNLSHFAPFAQRYAAHGLGVLMFDYRGFGQSTGRVSQRRAFEDGQTALNYLLHAKKIPPQNLVLWGFSLGNSICLHTAVQNATLPFKAVVAQSPFTSSTEMAAYGVSKHYKPWDRKQKILLPFIYLILWNRKLDNTRQIPRVKAPLLVAYSRQDERIPWQMSAALARLAPHGTQAYASPRGSHGEFGWLEKRALDFLTSLK